MRPRDTVEPAAAATAGGARTAEAAGTADLDARDAWIAERARTLTGRPLPARPVVVSDTSDFMAIDRDHVIDLDGRLYLVTGTEKEKRFGLDDEPKFWVKRAVCLENGRTHILKMVFRETIVTRVRGRRFSGVRSADKEGLVLERVAGDPGFMQGRAVRDVAGNLVRVVDFIQGVDLLSHLSDLALPHEEYCHARLPSMLARATRCVAGIVRLHQAGLCHGDIRSDHVMVEHGTGTFKWIDFDLDQGGPEYDVWSLGNLLHYVVAKGFVSFRDVRERLPDRFARLRPGDASFFFPHRVMSLCKVFPYLPQRLEAVLMRFSAGCRSPYETSRELLNDLNDVLADLS